MDVALLRSNLRLLERVARAGAVTRAEVESFLVAEARKLGAAAIDLPILPPEMSAIFDVIEAEQAASRG